MERGAMRVVLMTKYHAIKWPRLTAFSAGLAANADEFLQWNNRALEELCPIKWKSPGALIIVMPYARPLDEKEWSQYRQDNAIEFESAFLEPEGHDFKRENFGIYRGRVVWIDYARDD